VTNRNVSTLLANKRLRRRLVAYVALLGASLVLITVSSNPLVRDLQHGVEFAFRPVQVAVDGIAGNLKSIASTIADIDRLRQENAELRDENDRLDAESRSSAELKRENEQLTALLQLRSGLQYQTVTASVIARESSEARRALVIDRGSDDGLKVGQVVISAGGALAGRISEVGPNFSHVVLISDSTSTVIGQLLSSAATGKVLGQLGGALVMLDVDASAQVTIGEEVFTAGIELDGGIRSPYPKGLLIGKVVDVKRDPNDVVQTVFLEPASPLDRLEYLLVLTSYEGGITEPVQTDVPCDPTKGGTLPDSDEPCPSDLPGASHAPAH
jgi:rod shape-determining protein MreC